MMKSIHKHRTRLLKFGFHFGSGRNHGRIASWHRGGGLKHLYKFIHLGHYSSSLFKFSKLSSVTDHKRSAWVDLNLYSNGLLSYRLSSTYSHVDDGFSSSFLGSVLPGVFVNCVESFPNLGAAYARAGGSLAKVARHYPNGLTLLRLPSGAFRFFSNGSGCSLFSTVKFTPLVKNAGYNRRLGWRPIVRGCAMNPVDHPHGGRTRGGKIPSTPWARLAKGLRTSRSRSPKITII